MQSIFGAGYIPELHADEDHLKLPAIGHEKQFSEFVRSLRMLIGGVETTATR